MTVYYWTKFPDQPQNEVEEIILERMTEWLGNVKDVPFVLDQAGARPFFPSSVNQPVEDCDVAAAHREAGKMLAQTHIDVATFTLILLWSHVDDPNIPYDESETEQDLAEWRAWAKSMVGAAAFARGFAHDYYPPPTATPTPTPTPTPTATPTP